LEPPVTAEMVVDEGLIAGPTSTALTAVLNALANAVVPAATDSGWKR
jgi:hypothetical protein